MGLLPEWAPVKVAIRRMSDLPSLSAFLAGGTVVQGVTMNVGDRFLLVDEEFGNRNGLFQLSNGDDWVRPSDADESGDFVTGKQVYVQGGDWVGFWRYTNATFPGFAPFNNPSANPAFVFKLPFPQGGRIDPLALPAGVVPVPVVLVPADDNRAPQPWSPILPKHLNPFQAGTAPVNLGIDFTTAAPSPVNFGFPTRLTILGEELTIAGEALVVRL